jgi:hypothetical protein
MRTSRAAAHQQAFCSEASMFKRSCARIVVSILAVWPAAGIAQPEATCCTQSKVAATPSVITCPVPLTSCNGQCVDTRSDAQNCGGCSSACAGGRCVAGACECPPDYTLCPASGSSQICAQLMEDNHNCGMCGKVCDGKICIYGACVCPRGLALCGERCFDLRNDNDNCGVCGRHCRVEPPCERGKRGCTTCENGKCVPF